MNKAVTENYINHICDELNANRAAILVGSGFSRNAEKRSSATKQFPLWNDLSIAFASKLNSKRYEDLLNLSPPFLAEQVEAAYGRPELDRILQNTIPDDDFTPSNAHELLLSMPWTDVFTTNYDTLLERASERLPDKRFQYIKCKEDLVGSSALPRIVKLHGSFPSNRPFIVTSEDYREYPCKFAPFVNTVQQSILENTFCLIGFSGDDPNFEKWIGWIRDNLSESAPFIYLFSTEKLSDAHIQLLRKRKVIVVDIACICEKPKVSPSEQIYSLLSYMDTRLKSITISSWPNKKDIEALQTCTQNRNEPDFEQSVSLLKKIHLEYPGWVTAPSGTRNQVKLLIDYTSSIMQNLKNKNLNSSLDFLYEYNWFHAISMIPLSTFYIEKFEEYMNQHLPILSSNEEANMVIRIIQSIMQDCRESSEFEKWDDWNKKITTLLDSFKIENELIHALKYESCLCLLHRLNFDEFNNNLNNWNPSPREHIWALRKAGLLAECNALELAKSLIHDSLDSLRQELQHDSRNLALTSIESALMVLNEHIVAAEKVFAPKSDNEKAPEFEAKRHSFHKELGVDWNVANDYFISFLRGPYIFVGQQTKHHTFDFGEITNTSGLGNEEKELYASIAFMRFREETGHPFRIRNVVNGSQAAVYAAERLAYYSLPWAIHVIIRAGDPGGLDEALTRSVLSEFNATESNKWINFYLDGLSRLAPHLDLQNWFFINDYFGNCANILPEILSRWCYKSSVKFLDQILNALLSIYNTEKRKCYRQAKILIKRLMKAYTCGQLIEEKRLNILVSFPIIEGDPQDFPHPLQFLPIHNKPKSPADEEYNFITEFFENNIPNSNNIIFEIFIGLCNNGLLSAAHTDALRNRIEEDPTKVPHWYTQNLISEFEYNEQYYSSLLRLLEDQLNNDLKEKGVSFGNKRFLRFEQLIEQRLLTHEDLEHILPTLMSVIIKLLPYHKKSNFMFTSSFIQSDLHTFFNAMTKLLIQNPSWTFSEASRENINKIVEGTKKYGLEFPYFELMWQSRFGDSLNQKALLTLLFSDNRYNRLAALEAIIQDLLSENPISGAEILNEGLTMICNMVLFNEFDTFVSATHALQDILDKKPDLLDDNMIDFIEIGLSRATSTTKIIQHDSVDTAGQKGQMRVAASELAMHMKTFYEAQGKTITETITKWIEIMNDADEFIEIRNVKIETEADYQ